MDTAAPEANPSKTKDVISVIGKTTAGHEATFIVRGHDRVDKVAREMVAYFVDHGLLAPGEYGLALVREGVAQTLQDAARLEDYSIVDGDVLTLISKAPEVDG